MVELSGQELKMKDGKVLKQTIEDYNSIPRIEVQDSFIKEIEIKKQLLSPGDLKGNKPIYKIVISIIDDIGGRHKVTDIVGICKDKIDVRV